MKSFVAVVVLATAGLGCGIAASVGDQCGEQRSAYDRLQKKASGLAERGVRPDAPIVRHTDQQVAQAREALLACSQQPG